MSELSHLDASGKARMVDVGSKDETHREAVARGEVTMSPATFELLRSGAASKGDVLGVARVAGIMAAKRVPELLPLCHPIPITGVSVDFKLDPSRAAVLIEARVTVYGRTGAEMEALTAASVAALTIYDMLKAVDKDMVLGCIRLVRKSGGKSGEYVREGELDWSEQSGAGGRMMNRGHY